MPYRAGTTRTISHQLLAAADQPVIMDASSLPSDDRSGFEHVVASLPDIPEKEDIISELDGAIFPLPHSDVLLC